MTKEKVTVNKDDLSLLMTYAMGNIEYRHELGRAEGVMDSERNLFRRVSRASGIPIPKFDPEEF